MLSESVAQFAHWCGLLIQSELCAEAAPPSCFCLGRHGTERQVSSSGLILLQRL